MADTVLSISFWQDDNGYHIMRHDVGICMNFNNVQGIKDELNFGKNYSEYEEALIEILKAIQEQYSEFDIVLDHKSFTITQATAQTIWLP